MTNELEDEINKLVDSQLPEIEADAKRMEVALFHWKAQLEHQRQRLATSGENGKSG